MFCQFQCQKPVEINGIEWKELRNKYVSQFFTIEEIERFKNIEADICLVGFEVGGGMTNTGKATIIALPNGQVPMGVRLSRSCGANHGMVFGKKLVEITSIWSRNQEVKYKVSAVLYFVDEKNKIEKKDLFEIEVLDEDNFDFVPARYLHFEDAIRAVIDKSCCYHCRDLHYMNTQKK